MKHTIERVNKMHWIVNDKIEIEKVNETHWIVDDKIVIKYVKQFGDSGWCVFNADQFYQKIYDDFENALLKALGEPIRKGVMEPPMGIEN